ncbi:MAG: hypothetical protein LBQ61_06220 [Spirochaetales bacterium]|jgi:predicted RNA-binding protein (virulence factor B family)|nr:hypothetical protein [Spirochaetales bacterium]
MEIGLFNTLPVLKRSAQGLVLGDEGGEVLLPNREIPPGWTGELKELRVFVYNSDRETIRATTQTPRAVRGEFGWFLVKETNTLGAFLDWGIPKDLFVPHGTQGVPLTEGQWVTAFVAMDSRKTGIIGFTDLRPFIKNRIEGLTEGEKVKVFIRELHRTGARVIVNDLYHGLIYHQDLSPDLAPGQIREGWVRKIRGDGKLDIGLWQKNIEVADRFKTRLMQALEEQGGFLSLGDSSPPELIREKLGMSKRIFKMTCGILFKEEKIRLHGTGISLPHIRPPKVLIVKAGVMDLSRLVKPGYDPAQPEEPPRDGRDHGADGRNSKFNRGPRGQHGQRR